MGPSFPYTYHDRIANYRWKGTENGLAAKDLAPPVDQIKYIIKKLKENPYSRRAQAITWRPHVDPESVDPPCLQRLWCRVINGKLVFETAWRSRDLFKAWGANVNGMLAWARLIADGIGVDVDCYVDFTNALHIYGQKKVTVEVVDFIDRLMKREAKKYDPKYVEAYQEFQKTKFYSLYSKWNEIKKEIVKIGDSDKVKSDKLSSEGDKIFAEIDALKDY